MELEKLENTCKEQGFDLVPFHQTPHTGGTIYNDKSAVATYWHEIGGTVRVQWLIKKIYGRA
jgi:hypothetical protein